MWNSGCNGILFDGQPAGIVSVEMATNQSKERLLAAAKELFLVRGYAATTVDAICEKAELTKGSYYYFFDSKDLGLAVLDWPLR
jgi:AcrR family transcriptional regulator